MSSDALFSRRSSIPTRAKPRHLLIPIALFVLAASADVPADPASNTAAVPAMSAEEKQSELEKLLAIAQQRRAPIKILDLDVQLEDRPSIGAPDAPLIIVEFSDFQCPYCRKHALETMPSLISEWVDTGRARYLFHDYPIEANHPFARKAAEASRCAAEQGRYWSFRQYLFENSKALQPVLLVEHAKAAGLAPDAFITCLETQRQASKVAHDQRMAIDLGIHGTPAFLIGVPSASGDRMRVLRRIDGAQDSAIFARALTAVEREASGMSTKPGESFE